MSVTPTLPAEEAVNPDWGRPLLDRQVAMLGVLAESGLRMALALEQRALAEDAPGAAEPGAQGEDGPSAGAAMGPAEVFLAYTRVTRAVRLALMLQEKLIRELQAAEAATAETVDPRIEETKVRKARIERIVVRIGQKEACAYDRVQRATALRLDRDVSGDILNRPVSELIAAICKDLGLSPDWPALAEEAWAREEMAGGGAGWPLMGLGADGPGWPPPPMAEAGARTLEAAGFG